MVLWGRGRGRGLRPHERQNLLQLVRMEEAVLKSSYGFIPDQQIRGKALTRLGIPHFCGDIRWSEIKSGFIPTVPRPIPPPARSRPPVPIEGRRFFKTPRPQFAPVGNVRWARDQLRDFQAAAPEPHFEAQRAQAESANRRPRSPSPNQDAVHFRASKSKSGERDASGRTLQPQRPVVQKSKDKAPVKCNEERAASEQVRQPEQSSAREPPVPEDELLNVSDLEPYQSSRTHKAHKKRLFRKSSHEEDILGDAQLSMETPTRPSPPLNVSPEPGQIYRLSSDPENLNTARSKPVTLKILANEDKDSAKDKTAKLNKARLLTKKLFNRDVLDETFDSLCASSSVKSLPHSEGKLEANAKEPSDQAQGHSSPEPMESSPPQCNSPVRSGPGVHETLPHPEGPVLAKCSPAAEICPENTIAMETSPWDNYSGETAILTPKARGQTTPKDGSLTPSFRMKTPQELKRKLLLDSDSDDGKAEIGGATGDRSGTAGRSEREPSDSRRTDSEALPAHTGPQVRPRRRRSLSLKGRDHLRSGEGESVPAMAASPERVILNEDAVPCVPKTPERQQTYSQDGRRPRDRRSKSSWRVELFKGVKRKLLNDSDDENQIVAVNEVQSSSNFNVSASTSFGLDDSSHLMTPYLEIVRYEENEADQGKIGIQSGQPKTCNKAEPFVPHISLAMDGEDGDSSTDDVMVPLLETQKEKDHVRLLSMKNPCGPQPRKPVLGAQSPEESEDEIRASVPTQQRPREVSPEGGGMQSPTGKKFHKLADSKSSDKHLPSGNIRKRLFAEEGNQPVERNLLPLRTALGALSLSSALQGPGSTNIDEKRSSGGNDVTMRNIFDGQNLDMVTSSSSGEMARMSVTMKDRIRGTNNASSTESVSSPSGIVAKIDSSPPTSKISTHGNCGSDEFGDHWRVCRMSPKHSSNTDRPAGSVKKCILTDGKTKFTERNVLSRHVEVQLLADGEIVSKFASEDSSQMQGRAIPSITTHSRSNSGDMFASNNSQVEKGLSISQLDVFATAECPPSCEINPRPSSSEIFFTSTERSKIQSDSPRRESALGKRKSDSTHTTSNEGAEGLFHSSSSTQVASSKTDYSLVAAHQAPSAFDIYRASSSDAQRWKRKFRDNSENEEAGVVPPSRSRISGSNKCSVDVSSGYLLEPSSKVTSGQIPGILSPPKSSTKPKSAPQKPESCVEAASEPYPTKSKRISLSLRTEIMKAQNSAVERQVSVHQKIRPESHPMSETLFKIPKLAPKKYESQMEATSLGKSIRKNKENANEDFALVSNWQFYHPPSQKSTPEKPESNLEATSKPIQSPKQQSGKSKEAPKLHIPINSKISIRQVKQQSKISTSAPVPVSGNAREVTPKPQETTGRRTSSVNSKILVHDEEVPVPAESRNLTRKEVRPAVTSTPQSSVGMFEPSSGLSSMSRASSGFAGRSRLSVSSTAGTLLRGGYDSLDGLARHVSSPVHSATAISAPSTSSAPARTAGPKLSRSCDTISVAASSVAEEDFAKGQGYEYDSEDLASLSPTFRAKIRQRQAAEGTSTSLQSLFVEPSDDDESDFPDDLSCTSSELGTIATILDRTSQSSSRCSLFGGTGRKTRTSSVASRSSHTGHRHKPYSDAL